MPATAVPPVVDKEVPSWKSPNELIHERINFDDTIWGFGLAGGAYYKTPLRITYVKPGSRAQMAHIYPGDIVLKINGIESSTLTLEQAHEMILESGIHLKINVTSPEDLEDNYYCYQDPLVAAMEELKAKEIKYTATQRHPKVLGKTSHWGLQWPWKTKRKIIYKESNCYLVPSKFEEKHKDTRKPEVKQDDIVLYNIYHTEGRKKISEKNQNKSKITNLEDIKEDLSNENVDINEKDEVTNQNDSVDNKEEAAENNKSEVNDEGNGATEQISSIDENNEVTAIEQNGSVKINEEVEAAQDSSVVENNENIAEEQNSSVDKNENDIVAEENNTEVKTDEISVSEDNSSVNKNAEEDIAAQKEVVNLNDEQPIEATDTDTKANENNGKFENGDIPAMSESEKLIHNSR